jgi:pyruvate,water dikinase
MPYGVSELECQDEDLKNYGLLLGDFVHCWPPYSPIMAWARNDGICRSTIRNWDRLSVPGSKGFQWRVIDGLTYFAIMETTPEELAEREKVFRERIAPYMENWDEMWGKAIEDWQAVVKPFLEFNLEQASDAQLYQFFRDYMDQIWFEMWMRHFEWMSAAYMLFVWFRTALEELTGITPAHPLFKKIMAGFDNMMVKFNRELWGLADRAKELGVDNIFLTTEDDDEVLRKLEATDAGRKWFEEYRSWLKVRGWRCNRAEEWINNPSWIEKPSQGVPMLRQAITKGGVFTADREFERLVKEREEAEKELLAKISEDKRWWFEKLMKCAQRAGSFSEDHTYYFDMLVMALGRHITQELGKRFAKGGAIDEVDDIYMLMPDEMMKAAVSPERANLRPYAKPRREEWEKYMKLQPWELKPFIGDISKAGEWTKKDPLVQIIAEMPIVRPELKADLYGSASAAGVAEGIARVIPDESHFKELQPGEILVCTATMPTWTPLFNIAAGVVTDGGGNLSHAVIVGRECGLPVVAGTLEGTKKIKTGMKIRVDGDMCAVYILEQ